LPRFDDNDSQHENSAHARGLWWVMSAFKGRAAAFLLA
jgi:hypothetical protein